jgi:predicted deacetylase
MAKINMKSKKIAATIIVLSIVSVLIIVNLNTKATISLDPTNPALVVIRLDDVQDYAFKEGQLFLFEHSQNNNIPLSLAIVPNYFGNDQEIVETVKQTIDNGSEVAVHGWEHENLSQSSYLDQKTKLIDGKNRLEEILDCKINLLVPPMFSYNNDTIKAMEDTGYEILSGLAEYHKFGWLTEKIQSIPATIELSDYSENRWQIKSKDQIITELNNSIEKYGYATIVTHPQEFYTNEEFNEKTGEQYQAILKTISETYSFNTLKGLTPLK